MSRLQRLADMCILEALKHSLHTNLSTQVFREDLVYIVSFKVISIAFVIDGEFASDTIVNDKNSSVEKLILDYMEQY